jgi:hypothetical protein
VERLALSLIWKRYQAAGKWQPAEHLQREIDRTADPFELWETLSEISPASRSEVGATSAGRP